jgi:5-methylcytosine-specific restriction endonuclease McrA
LVTRRKLTKDQRMEILEEAGFCCWYCHQPIAYDEMELDHALALGLGGEDNPLNLVPACVPCHRGAGTGKTADDRKRMAKADRQRRKHEEGRGRKRKGKPIKSAGFPKGLRKKLNGEVVRRDD